MINRTVTPEDLARLESNREQADRLYNEALTALDAARQSLPEFPHPPPPPDEEQVAPLNDRWRILGDGASPATGLTRWAASRAGRFVWRLVGPYLERQQHFNAALVEHVNRNVAIHREWQRAMASTIEALRDRVRDLVTFELLLMTHLQRVTRYVDAKELHLSAMDRRLHEDNRELIDLLDDRTDSKEIAKIAIGALGGAIHGVSDELAKRWESMVARERRYDAKVASLGAAHEELRGALAVLQQASTTLKRELERLHRIADAGVLAAGSSVGPGEGKPSAPHAVEAPGSRPDAPRGDFEQGLAASIDSYKYVGFEDRFRGSQEDIRARVEEYMPYFSGASDVLDVGCGRGEFLEALTARGISCRGLDLNHEMVEICRTKNLDVVEDDALTFLQRLPDGALGGLFAAQVVEHLQPDYLLGFMEAAYHKLRPGSTMVLETINVACWFAFFASYIRDLTHVRPLHPDTLSYFVQASGFQRVTVRYRAPYVDADKLQPIPTDGVSAETFNANVEKLNGLLFTHLDYAVIAARL